MLLQKELHSGEICGRMIVVKEYDLLTMKQPFLDSGLNPERVLFYATGIPSTIPSVLESSLTGTVEFFYRKTKDGIALF